MLAARNVSAQNLSSTLFREESLQMKLREDSRAHLTLGWALSPARRDADTETHGRSGHVKMKAEAQVMYPRAKKGGACWSLWMLGGADSARGLRKGPPLLTVDTGLLNGERPRFCRLEPHSLWSFAMNISPSQVHLQLLPRVGVPGGHPPASTFSL